VDEHRAVFHPRVWIVPQGRKQLPEEKVEQRWFIGAHANVGGGYLDDHLHLIPLHWMRTKAEKAGVRFEEFEELKEFPELSKPTPTKFYLPAAGDQKEDDPTRVRPSYKEWLRHTYRLVSRRPYNRPIFPWGTKHDNPPIEYENQTIDDTVLKRIMKDPYYRPQNIRDCLVRSLAARVVVDKSTESRMRECWKKFKSID
jgi:hypothetical protein